MGFAAALFLPPVQLKKQSSSQDLKNSTSWPVFGKPRGPKRSIVPLRGAWGIIVVIEVFLAMPNHQDQVVGTSLYFCSLKKRMKVARLFGPAIFEASKLKVLFLGVDEEKHPGKLPRTYTLTHSDITSKITLAVSNTINRAQLQGWYNRLQRDEVVAEWKKVQGKMSLHVHCHISGGHFLLDLIANLRYYIFSKELPVVLKAFVHGDVSLFNSYPELEEATVWVYFHSNLPEFNRVECWGPLRDAASTGQGSALPQASPASPEERPQRCPEPCDCCFPPQSLIPWPHDCQDEYRTETSG